jgi:hypothetical protein
LKTAALLSLRSPRRFAPACLLAFLHCTTGCAAGPQVQPVSPVPPVPPRIEPDQPFSLSVGAWARVGDSSLLVGFDAVSSDSRCPRLAQCVWAGDATVLAWLRAGVGPKVEMQLHTGAGLQQAAQALGHELRLLQLTPEPVSGSPVSPGGYRAQLTLSTTQAAANER